MKKASALLAVLLLLSFALAACSGGGTSTAASGAASTAGDASVAGEASEAGTEEIFFDSSKLGITAVDDLTLEVNLVAPTPYFLELTAFPTYMPVNMDVVNDVGEAWAVDPSTYIGNGPYKMTEWVPNSYIMMEKNPEYWEADKTGPETIKFNLIEDDNAQYNAFQSGELQFIRNIPVNEVATLKETSDAFDVVSLLGTYYVSYNVEAEPFTDPMVRQAFTLAIDRDFMANQVGNGSYTPAGGFVSTGLNDANPPAQFREVGGNYYDPSAAAYEANLAEAKAILAEAGYPEGEGFPVVTYVYNDTTLHQAVAEALQDMWSKLGVTVNIEKQEWSTFQNTRKNGDFQIARDGWLCDYNDPISMLDMFVSTSGNNNPHWKNADYDQLISDIKSSGDPTGRFDMMHKAEDMLFDEWVVAPIMFYGQPTLRDPAIADSSWEGSLGFDYFMYTQGITDLSVCVGPEPDTIDPALNTSVDGGSYTIHVFEGLYRLNRDGVPEPAQASSVDVSDDGLTYTFHLREGLKFSDGTPITAQSFADSWIRAIDPATGADYSYMFDCIAGYSEAIGE